MSFVFIFGQVMNNSLLSYLKKLQAEILNKALLSLVDINYPFYCHWHSQKEAAAYF
jgi:hypothetical protein